MDIQKQYWIKAKKSLGQNFLKDDSTLSKIIKANQITWSHIIEVGPWYWALSEKILAQKPKIFEMIELDAFLVRVLQKRIESENWDEYCEDIRLQGMDILDYDTEWDGEYQVIANIPYYITSPILDHFLYRVKKMPDSMTILMQKDVGDKIMKQYHYKKPKSSVLSLFIAKKMDSVKICDVPAICFDPAPKVDSSVLQFTKKSYIDETDDEEFLSFIKKAFCEPRKKLISNLWKNGYTIELLKEVFQKHKIIENIRAEDLDLDSYLSVLKSLNKA